MLSRLGFPSVGPHRRFVTAIVVDTVGSGIFMPMSMLYFLAVTDLSLIQVGTAISLAALLALPVTPIAGTLVDRYGPRTMMLVGNVLQGLGMAASASWARCATSASPWAGC